MNTEDLETVLDKKAKEESVNRMKVAIVRVLAAPLIVLFIILILAMIF